MPTNLDIAEWAAAALPHIQCSTGTEYDDARMKKTIRTPVSTQRRA
jgi:hypothetical protein